MKNIQLGFIFIFWLLFVSLHLRANESTNLTASFKESWQTISNRWASTPLEKIKQTAEQGDVTAQYYLGCNYKNGDGVEKNPAEAFKWMNLATQQGMPRAQFFLGWMYDSGSGAEQDYSEAAKLYRLAAEQGHSQAQNNLGWLLKQGLGVPENQIEAIKWFNASAEQGNKLAAENLAWTYAGGVFGPTNKFGQGAEAQIRSGGVAPNHELAEKWMFKAIDTNSAEGQYQFGNLLHREFTSEGFQDDSRFADAGAWYKKSAEQGYAAAQLALAEMYHTGQLGNDQRSNCIPWFLKAAAQGNADAQATAARLPEYYPNNPLLALVDPIDALRQAAEHHDLNAQFDLAWRYHHGDGVVKDDVEAFKWMEKAAQHGVSPITRTIYAHYYLGVMYEKGEGVTNNLAKACELYQEAAVGGNKPEPFVRLGQMYEKGEGVPQDDNLATTTYFVATQFGFSPTSDDRARCTAIESLFNLYVQGRGLPDDKAAVAKQLTEVRQSPILTAKGQMLLGEIYFQSKIVPQDLVEAATWIRLAANQNFEDAHNQLDKVEFVMSPPQKEAAKRRFDDLNGSIERAKNSYKQLENFRRTKAW